MKQLFNVIEQAIKEALDHTHTATIGRVVKVDSKTIDVQPVLNWVHNGESIKLPVFAEVPPVFLQGGGSYTAYPIAIGDYALLIFSERCFDAWYNGSDEVRPPELRMHDYSDAFALVGINPLNAALTIPTVITQIGNTHQEGDYTHTGNRTQTGDYDLNGKLTQIGDQDITGNVTISEILQAAQSILGAAQFTSIKTGGQSGVSGSFTTADSKTVTVTNGIITSIA